MPTPQRSLPQFSPSPRELDDVELLRMDALGPTAKFGGVDSMVSLEVPIAVAKSVQQAGALELIDPEGVPLAILTPDDWFDLPSEYIALSGPIKPLPGAIRRAFGPRYLSPLATKPLLESYVLAVPVVASLTVRDLEEIADRAGGSQVLLLAMTGSGTPVDMSAHGLIRATLVAAERIPNSMVIAVPVAARKDTADDRAFREKVVAAYAPGADILWPEGTGERSSEVDGVVESDRPSGTKQGVVVFFTGLSGSGKSTIAQALRDRLLEVGVRPISLLDGDRVRRRLSAGLTFSPEDRETNIERIGWVAAEISRHGGLAICSPIAPFDRTRRAARAMTDEVGGAFVLVHVATPVEECERRDRKGLYAKARRGEIEHFTGISSPYEVPEDADLTVDTTDKSPDEVLLEVLQLLIGRHLIDSDGLAADESMVKS